MVEYVSFVALADVLGVNTWCTWGKLSVLEELLEATLWGLR